MNTNLELVGKLLRIPKAFFPPIQTHTRGFRIRFEVLQSPPLNSKLQATQTTNHIQVVVLPRAPAGHHGLTLRGEWSSYSCHIVQVYVIHRKEKVIHNEFNYINNTSINHVVCTV